MNPSQVRKFCRALPGTTEQIQWGDDLLFKVGGRMYLCMGLSPESGYCIKCAPESFLALTDSPGIKPAPYLARAQWILIDPKACKLPRATIARLIRESYDMVLARLPRKRRPAIAVEAAAHGKTAPAARSARRRSR